MGSSAWPVTQSVVRFDFDQSFDRPCFPIGSGPKGCCRIVFGQSDERPAILLIQISGDIPLHLFHEVGNRKLLSVSQDRIGESEARLGQNCQPLIMMTLSSFCTGLHHCD